MSGSMTGMISSGHAAAWMRPLMMVLGDWQTHAAKSCQRANAETP
jgi:hypothetical protein